MHQTCQWKVESHGKTSCFQYRGGAKLPCPQPRPRRVFDFGNTKIPIQTVQTFETLMVPTTAFEEGIKDIQEEGMKDVQEESKEVKSQDEEDWPQPSLLPYLSEVPGNPDDGWIVQGKLIINKVIGSEWRKNNIYKTKKNTFSQQENNIYKTGK